MFKEFYKDGVLGTDIYISIYSDFRSEIEIAEDINSLLSLISKFENKYSRFISGNYLSGFNDSTTFTVDKEFKEILLLCKKYFTDTNAVFNPSVLPLLITEGYNVSKFEGIYNKSVVGSVDEYSIDLNQLVINNYIVTKPLNLKIDLGGIGKGYLLKILSIYLSKKYTNYCIDLGGDMILMGEDKQKEYPYWAIEIENPLSTPTEMPTLMIKDLSVATSGVNKRKWTKQNQERNHLIDTHSEHSVNNDIICSTVIESDPVEADVYAKVLLIMGLENGLGFAQTHQIPVIFITKQGQIVYSDYAEKYIWK